MKGVERFMIVVWLAGRVDAPKLPVLFNNKLLERLITMKI
jgi:hypothetical protein